MARIAVFVDHDIVVRHFVLSGVLAPLWAEHDVVFVFPQNHRRVRIDPGGLAIPRFRTIPVAEDRAYLYRCLYHATLLRNIRRGRKQKEQKKLLLDMWWDILGWRGRFEPWRGYFKPWICSWRATLPLYRRWMLGRIGEDEALNRLLAEEKPDVIVHPTVLEGLFVSDLVQWGRAHGTPTVFIMNSWDNPSTRAMLAGHPDRLVVWGEQTAKDAVRHLRTPADRVVRLGAAQFDVYRRSPKTAPAEFRRKLGVPDGAKVLLYAGSSKGLDESRHLLQLERAIESGQLRNCFVVYRPHPWRQYPEGEADFFSLTWKHVVLEHSMEACYRQSRAGQRIRIELADYEDTHVALSAADAVISPLSTILLEAALHGKPVAVYLPDEDMAGDRFMYAVARMTFFREFFERVGCVKCESPTRFVDDCGALLRITEEPGIATRLKTQCAYFVESSDRAYAERLGEVIGALLRSERKTC